MAAMNMANMQPNGGPVGGSMMIMNNTESPAVGGNQSDPITHTKTNLNTYIYEYFLRIRHYDIARALINKDNFEIKTLSKKSPGRGKDGQVNGADDAMEMDTKDGIPADLPRPAVAETSPESDGFLFEWFCIFSDLFLAHRGGKHLPGGMSHPAMKYLLNHQQQQRFRETQQNQNLMRPGMLNQNQLAAMQRRIQNGVPNGDIRNKLTPQQLAMLHQQNQAANMQNQQISRGEQAEGDPNNRPATPADGENGGSPSKRPRLEGQQQLNGGMMPNGRPGVPGVGQPGMMIQAGFNPANMNNPQFRPNGNMPQKAMAANMANGMNMMANAGSPMMQTMNQFGEGMPGEMYPGRMPAQVMQGGPHGQSGNHALQDYQMQLMLLEQQNKKRLMMARQEQHDNTNTRDGAPMPAGVNMPPGMSPSGSRTGTSPNPTEQMKRAPQIGGMPSSPSAGDMAGRSPANMPFMNGNMPPTDFNPAMFMKDGQNMGPGAQGMRGPAGGVDMNAANRPQQPGRMAGQFGPGGQPMANQPSQGQPQPVGTPGQRTEMPPPQAPATGNSAQRGNQPASPANSNAPPTPSQASKSNPSKKKAAKEEASKKRPQKKSSTTNAPPEDNPPATPNASTPVTPMHGTSFNGSTGKPGGPGAQANQQQPNPGMPPGQPQMPGPDLNQNFVGEFSDQHQFNLDFSTLENTDVLENFDFDSFLNTNTDEPFNFGDSNGMDSFMDGPGE